MPALAYLMPEFHNPTGRTMTPEEVEAFVDGAQRAGTLLVLDETTAGLDIDRPVAATAFPDSDRIVRIGSLGKTVWGGLRVGWVRANADIIGAVLDGAAGAPRVAVVINAAAALLAAGAERDPKSARQRVEEAIDAGRARDLLARWVGA